MTRWKDFTNKYFYKKYQVETLEWKSIAEKNIYPEVQKGKKEDGKHKT